jgi:hypothetical protein
LLSSRRLDWPTHCSSRRGNTRRRCWLALLSSLKSTRLGEGSLVGARHGHGLQQAGTKQYTQQVKREYNTIPPTCFHDCDPPCAMSPCEGQRRACSRSVADRHRRMTSILRHLLMYNISAAGHDRERVLTLFTLLPSSACASCSPFPLLATMILVSCSWQYTAVEVRTSDAKELT